MRKAIDRNVCLPGFTLLAVLLIVGATQAWSQDAIKVDRLTVALWPEYDRPDVLVTYKLELSPEVALPAQVDLPIPAEVGIPHAVAKRGSDGGLYLAPATRVVHGEWAVMTITSDRPQLHLEYYAPLSTSADLRSFTYRWPGGLEIAEFNYEVLWPLSARDIAATPTPSTESVSDIGATLYTGNLGAHTTAQQGTIAITYSNPSGRLSVAPVPPSTLSPPALVSSSEEIPVEEKSSLPFIPLVMIGIGTLVLVGLWLARRKR